MADLDHSDVVFGLIIIEGDAEVGGETQHVILVGTQSVEQSPRLGLRDATTGFRVESGRTLLIAGREDLPVFPPDGLECFLRQAGVSAGFGCLNLPMRADEEFAHLFRPPQLLGVFTDFL